jgi:hypothetical protein
MEGTNIYEIRPSTNKGLGVFANEHIPRGSRIVCETPIFTAPSEPGLLDVNDVYYRFSFLQGEDREKYLQLHAAQVMTDFIMSDVATNFPQILREHIAKVVSIFETNAFKMESTRGEGTSGIFAIASRINHSCSPNANQTWNSRIGCLTVHAIKDIPINEEITIPYVFPTLDRSQRLSGLKGYGFVCTCPICDDFATSTPSGEVSRKRRQQIYRLDQDLTFFTERNSVFGQQMLGPLNTCLIDQSGAEQLLNPCRN